MNLYPIIKVIEDITKKKEGEVIDLSSYFTEDYSFTPLDMVIFSRVISDIGFNLDIGTTFKVSVNPNIVGIDRDLLRKVLDQLYVYWVFNELNAYFTGGTSVLCVMNGYANLLNKIDTVFGLDIDFNSIGNSEFMVEVESSKVDKGVLSFYSDIYNKIKKALDTNAEIVLLSKEDYNDIDESYTKHLEALLEILGVVKYADTRENVVIRYVGRLGV